MQHLQPGTTLQGGKYRIEQVLGQGGFGRVLIISLLILSPVLAMAQASGGQISRSTEHQTQKVKRETIKQSDARQSTVQLDKYQQMDNRVRYGSYRIIGTAQVIKAKEGENLKKIANRLLGPEMECYLEVYNGIKASDPLTEGQEIKIPKLEYKKKKESPKE